MKNHLTSAFLTLLLAAASSAHAQDRSKVDAVKRIDQDPRKALSGHDTKQSLASGVILDSFLAGVERRVLPNGLTLITREQKGLGVVAICAWVKAGYFHEPDEVAGMAHLFEHMLFKGSKKFPSPEEAASQVAAVGGSMNADTSYDHTRYFVVVPKEGFQRALEFQTDAIMNPLFDPAEVRKEAEVVIEESNRKLDNPPALATERMFATAFLRHRMKRWRIGSNEVLRSIRRQNLLAFFEGLYRPGNIVVAITGDISSNEAYRAALETFSEFARGEVKKERGPEEPPQTAFRYARSAADIKQSYSVLGWHTPGVGHPDEIALNVLAQILGNGRSSRLFARAVGPDAASTISAQHGAFDEVGMLWIEASFDEKNRAEAERRTLVEVERIKAHGPAAHELARAISATESGIAFGIEDALGQAQTLARYEALHGYQALGKRLSEMRALNAERVREVARRYLTTENLTLYHYAPLDAKEIVREEALAKVVAVTKIFPEGIADAAMPPAPAPVRGAGSEPSRHKLELTNGATLVVTERPGAPLVSVGAYFAGGRIDEDWRNAGITRLMAHSMRRGTATRSAREIDREIEFLGSQIGFDVTEDYVGFTNSVMGPYFTSALGLLADVVLYPSFPPAGVTEEKFLQAAEIRRSLDSATERPSQLFFQNFYQGHPYGLPATGYAGSLGELDSEALRGWWKNHIVADGAVIFVVGDIAVDEARRLVEARFGKLPRRQASRPQPPLITAPTAHTVISEYRSRKQSAIVIGFPSVPRTHEDWPALSLLQSVSSGWKGTLFLELRGRRSLAYAVGARQASTARSGAFIAYLATEATKEKEAREALITEIRKLALEGFGETQLATAKSSLAGAARIHLQKNSAQVEEFARNHFSGVPVDFTAKLDERTQPITLQEVRRVAAKYLTHDRYVEAILHGKP